MKTKNYFKILVLLLMVILMASACSLSTGGKSKSSSSTTIRVGSKNFTEEYIVGNMYALMLEQYGFTVEKKLNLGGTPIAQQAIVNDEIDLYPEYTSTALLTVLKENKLATADAIYNAVKSGYEKQFNLTWLDPSPFNDTQALAMTQKRSSELGITTFSELSTAAPKLILGGPAEFQSRSDGLPGLQKAYGGFQFAQFKQLGTGSLRYDALLKGDIDVVVAFSTDGQIQGDNLVLLKDDKNFYPPYNIAPVVRMDVLKANPEIATALNKLAPYLTTPIMSSLNWKVEGPDKMDPATVARNFLLDNGLINSNIQ